MSIHALTNVFKPLVLVPLAIGCAWSLCAPTVAWSQVHYQVGSDEEIPTPLVAPSKQPAAAQLSTEPVLIDPSGQADDVRPLTLEEFEAISGAAEEMITPLPFSYRNRESDWTWVAAGQYGFGMFSMRDTGYLESDHRSGFNFGVGLHFLEGTMSPDLHPRLWDFTVGYQHRDELGAGISYDVAVNFGIFSDFEDSARDGVRFPSHLVVTGYLSSRLMWVLGVDYLDRDDYTVLPVAGLRWRPTEGMYLNLEIPEPEIGWQYGSSSTIYFKGQLGGGSWDIEYVNAGNDVMTYRQWEIILGHARTEDTSRTGIELGYLVDRALEFRGGSSDIDLPDVWLVRLVTVY